MATIQSARGNFDSYCKTENDTLLHRAQVLHKTLNLAISRSCSAEYGEEMYHIFYARTGPLLFSLNPIVLWRSPCCCHSTFLNSPVSQRKCSS